VPEIRLSVVGKTISSSSSNTITAAPPNKQKPVAKALKALGLPQSREGRKGSQRILSIRIWISGWLLRLFYRVSHYF
jgi:hypothetical protein